MQNKYLAMTPPMGWNSWNTFTWNINEELIMGAADALCASGLKDKGYAYIVIDDCWSLKQRDDEDRLVADPEKFPHGMKFVADYVHSKGLKFGMYSCCGTHTCAGYPGSFEHEFIDAETFASWGVDYLKYDNCYKPNHIDGEILYKRMSLALRNCGRDIVLSACNWGTEDVHSWVRCSGAQLFRSTYDIHDNFESVKEIFTSQIEKIHLAGPYCHNDMDMLVVGMHGSSNNEWISGNIGACTDTEYRTHFALWAVMGSPLMIGCDIRNMTDATLETLGNEDLIRINQDVECRNPYCIRHQYNPESVMVLVKPLSDGTLALCFVNLGDQRNEMSLQFWDVGIPYAANRGLEMYNCYTKENEGKFAERYVAVLEPHDSLVLIAKPVKLK